jgi:cellulose synthase (UDP-forming)
MNFPIPSIDMTYLPAAIVLLALLGLRWLPLNNATRLVVKSSLLLLALRYFGWRSTATLNFNSPPEICFSVGLYAIEAISFFSFLLLTLKTMWSSDQRRSQQADRYESLIHVVEYRPTVDLLIPTGNQPEYQVRRTILACQAQHYASKKIYVLDHLGRDAIAVIATELGCAYLAPTAAQHDATQRDPTPNDHLNRAIQQTHGELIAVIDADFVPFRNFLDRVVGFFHRSPIALVQTPQSLPHPGHRGRDYRAARDRAPWASMNPLLGRGSGYVIRRESLAALATPILDGAITRNLVAAGARLVYLNEPLSMAQGTQCWADWLDQRWRSLQGHWQWYVGPARRSCWRQLSLLQRGWFVGQVLHFCQPLWRLVWLIAPIVSLTTGIRPVQASWGAMLLYFVPFWLALVAVQGWVDEGTSWSPTDRRTATVGGQSRSYFWAEVDAVAFCLPALYRTLTRRSPTPPAPSTRQRNYNWSQNIPLAVILLWTIGAMVWHLWSPSRGGWRWPSVDWLPQYLWLAYNAVMLSGAIAQAIDHPIRRMVDRLPLQLPCRFLVAGEKWPGRTIDLSEQGARIQLLPDDFPAAVLPEVMPIELGYPALRVDARVVATSRVKRQTHIQVAFQNLDQDQQRQLMDLIYTSPQDWQRRSGLPHWDAWRAVIGSWSRPSRPMLRHHR